MNHIMDHPAGSTFPPAFEPNAMLQIRAAPLYELTPAFREATSRSTGFVLTTFASGALGRPYVCFDEVIDAQPA